MNKKLLKEVCLDFIVPQRDKPTAFDGDIPWCRIEDIEGRYLNGSKSNRKVSKELAEKMNMHLCPKGTVICACSASIGNQAITTVDCYTNQTFIGIVANPQYLNNVYLYYFFASQANHLKEIGQGATIKYISQNKFKTMQIPVPPLSEQQRIVTLLDSEFAKIDALKANAERNLQNAKDLFQAALKKELEPKKGWKTFTLGQVCDIARGGSPRPIKSFLTNDPTGIRWIKIGDTEVGGKYISSTKERIIKEGVKSSRYVKVGDFLLSNSMSFGRPYILKVDGCIHDGWLVIREYNKAFTQDFLYYLLLSPLVAKQFENGARGSTVRNLNTDIVSSVKVSVPEDLSEQTKMVSALDTLNEKCKNLQANYEKTIALCDDLKQALLRKAFNGEL